MSKYDDVPDYVIEWIDEYKDDYLTLFAQAKQLTEDKSKIRENWWPLRNWIIYNKDLLLQLVANRQFEYNQSKEKVKYRNFEVISLNKRREPVYDKKGICPKARYVKHTKEEALDKIKRNGRVERSAYGFIKTNTLPDKTKEETFFKIGNIGTDNKMSIDSYILDNWDNPKNAEE